MGLADDIRRLLLDEHEHAPRAVCVIGPRASGKRSACAQACNHPDLKARAWSQGMDDEAAAGVVVDQVAGEGRTTLDRFFCVEKKSVRRTLDVVVCADADELGVDCGRAVSVVARRPERRLLMTRRSELGAREAVGVAIVRTNAGADDKPTHPAAAPKQKTKQNNAVSPEFELDVLLLQAAAAWDCGEAGLGSAASVLREKMRVGLGG